jgi:Holliday junction DNA helicase RuvB
VASRSRGVPRIANRLLRRVRDVYNDPTPAQVDEVMVDLGVDSWGLESVDRNLITTIYDRFDGGPVGVRTLAAAMGVAEETLTGALEPYLLRRQLLDVTERGRQLTNEGWMYCRLMADRLRGES